MSTWTQERIAQLRADCFDRTDVFLGTYVIQAADLRSLLDELESACKAERNKNAELILASEQLSACSAELESVRSERDALVEGLRSGRLLANAVHPENRQDA